MLVAMMSLPDFPTLFSKAERGVHVKWVGGMQVQKVHHSTLRKPD